MIMSARSNILMERLDNQVLLFDLQKNLPYVLNGVASFIFLNSDGKLSKEEIAKKVCREFDVEYHKALDDINEIYLEFINKELIKDA